MADLSVFLPRSTFPLLGPARDGEDAFATRTGTVLFCDVAGFTYTGVRPAGHWESQAAIASELKQANPNLIVSPWVAVWAYPAQNYPIPTAAWVREQGMKAVSFDVFDGVFFFPWNHFPFTGETIRDVAGDPEYVSAFIEVFAAAQ